MTSYSTSTTLVIVESPAKCKKIEGFLGPGYRCIASFGHLRELPSLNHIDINNDFKPTFAVSDKKRKYVSSLKKAINESGEVILATDDDREGEAIAWHICMIFDLNIATTKRIIFHEITEEAVTKAVLSPTRINMDIVHAQQTRQILDLVLGFKISPTLWKSVAHRGLSAGRCQTPALKLVYENQKEVDSSKGRQVYTNTGLFRIGSHVLSFEHNKEFEREDEIIEFYEQSAEHTHIFSCSTPKNVSREPPTPLNTSRLQQLSSNELKYSPKETMRLCQSLYEGGHITYMRTDSKKYAKAFLSQTESYIIKKFDKTYVNSDKSIQHLTNDKSNPHEAIRPTKIYVSKLPEKFSNKEARLYKLIRETTLQSCMAPAKLWSIKGSVTSPNGEYSRKCEQVSFLGWMAVGSSQKGDVQEKEYKLLSSFSSSKVDYTQITSKVHVKDLKQHYTEARLVQLLEDKGIGRPSTFSMLIDKIQERDYVKRDNIEGKKLTCKDFELDGVSKEITYTETTREYGNERNKLVIQPTGIIVIEFLEEHFSELFQYEYTKTMEDNLDKIAERAMEGPWTTMIKEYHTEIVKLLDELKKKKPEKVEYKIDETHCYIIGKNGPVIKCNAGEKVSFKPVKKNLDIRKLQNGDYTLEEIEDKSVKDEYNLGVHEEHDVILKKGRFGIYAQWGSTNVSLKSLGNRPIENIQLEEVKALIEQTINGTREINENMSIRTSKRGQYVFFKTSTMKKPKFLSLKDCTLDFMKCELEEIKQWIFDTHKVS